MAELNSTSFVVLALDIASLGNSAVNILYVALGLGLVIFFHELGHFAVAKWCDVFVERFSIGFGPILWSMKWGETEYALSAIPFGGYVKMLGQDDADPSQMTSPELQEDPRSYTSKGVLQRMAIISAGVIMNVITGTIFCAIAFGLGHYIHPPVLGIVHVGQPAWEAGLERGDLITRVDGRDVTAFHDVALAVALSSGPVRIEGQHRDGRTFDLKVTPERSGKNTRPSIGLEPSNGLRLARMVDNASPTVFGSAAARATPEFRSGDQIAGVNGEPVKSFADFQDRLTRFAGEAVQIEVERPELNSRGLPIINDSAHPPKSMTMTVEPNFFRDLGLRVDCGPITAMKNNSPAKAAGLEVGDKLAKINGQSIGTEIDPMRLPHLLFQLAGTPVEIVVTRETKSGPRVEMTKTITPLPLAGWVEHPMRPAEALSIPALGIAIDLVPVVVGVAEGSPAAEVGIQPSCRLISMTLIRPENVPRDLFSEAKQVYRFDEKQVNNWAYAFWGMQQARQRTVELNVMENGKERTVTLTPVADPDWPLPMRGFITEASSQLELATSVPDALHKAWNYSRNQALNIYFTLGSLVTGRLSPTELNGPVTIAKVAYSMAEQGISSLLLFLSFLSINLAVLNFLPIPVLDGGHMFFLFWEAISRRKPSEAIQRVATVIGLMFVVSLMVFVLFLDLFWHR